MIAATEMVERFIYVAHAEARASRCARRLAGDLEVLSAAMLGLLDAAIAFRVQRSGQGGFEAFSRRCVRNRIRAIWRSPGARPWRLIGDAELSITCPQPDATYETVHEALKLLPHHHADILRRHFGINGDAMSVEKIAKQDGIGTKAVRLRLANAKLRMAEAVELIR